MKLIEIIDTLSKLSPENEKKLRSLIEQKSFRRGEIINNHNNMLSHSFYIVRGSARAFYTRNGKDHTYSFAFDDEFVMIPHMMATHPDSTMSIEFMEPTDVVFIPHARLRDSINENPYEANLFHIAALRDYCAVLEERYLMLQNTSARERYQWVVDRYPRLLERSTITQIASFLGVTKETIYRIRSGKY